MTAGPFPVLIQTPQSYVGGSGILLLPTGPSAGTAVPTGAANTFGAWTQLAAAATEDDLILGIALTTFQVVANGIYVECQIGVGGVGAEVAIAAVRASQQWVTAAGVMALGAIMLPIPVRVASGARIAARVADVLAATDSISVSLLYAKQSDLIAF